MADSTPTLVTYQTVLRDELEYRKSRNPGYSLRAFARDLAMAPSSLTEVLGGFKGVSLAKARKLARRLGLREDLREAFVLSARAQHARAVVDRETARKQLEELADRDRPRVPLTTTMVGWVTEAVLKLSERRGIDTEPSALAARLGVPIARTRFALRYLARLGFLRDTPPSRAFLAYLGEGRRLNVDYEQILELARRAHRDADGAKDEAIFAHEPLLLDAQGVRKARRLLERCIDDILRLETTSSKARLCYICAQIFGAEQADS